MTETVENLNSEVRGLASAVERLPLRSKAAIFGTCGRVFVPLAHQAERRSQGKWSSPDFSVALELIQAFATGSAQADDYRDLRAQLVATPISGDHPWSTYAQDAIICIDGGLAAASADSSVKSELIYYALEPLICSLEIRQVELIKIYGTKYWGEQIIKDAAMRKAIEFLRNSIEMLSKVVSVDTQKLDRLASDATVALIPGES